MLWHTSEAIVTVVGAALATSAAKDGPLKNANLIFGEDENTLVKISSTVSRLSFRIPLVHDTKIWFSFILSAIFPAQNKHSSMCSIQ